MSGQRLSHPAVVRLALRSLIVPGAAQCLTIFHGKLTSLLILATFESKWDQLQMTLAKKAFLFKEAVPTIEFDSLVRLPIITLTLHYTITDKPFANILNNTQINNYCSHCFNQAPVGKKLMTCSACAFARYCSKDCQKFAWKDHKPECERLKAVCL